MSDIETETSTPILSLVDRRAAELEAAAEAERQAQLTTEALKPRIRLEPLADMVIYRIEDAPRTAAGLYMPETAEDPKIRRVVAVGPGRFFDDGTRQVPTVKAGDMIMLGPHANTVGNRITGELLHFCREGDIWAIICPIAQPCGCPASTPHEPDCPEVG